MALLNLVNTIQGPGGKLVYAGEPFDSDVAAGQIAALQAAGGIFIANSASGIAAAAAIAQQLRASGGTAVAIDAIMVPAYAAAIASAPAPAGAADAQQDGSFTLSGGPSVQYMLLADGEGPLEVTLAPWTIGDIVEVDAFGDVLEDTGIVTVQFAFSSDGFITVDDVSNPTAIEDGGRLGVRIYTTYAPLGTTCGVRLRIVRIENDGQTFENWILKVRRIAGAIYSGAPLLPPE